METKTFPNGVTGNYYYSANGNLETLTYASGTAAPLLDLSYTYDNVSNIDTKTKDGVLYDYSYDNLYQLAGVTIPSVTSQNESFSYDEVGNRLSSIDKPNWSYDNNNQLNSYNGVNFGYDDNGNTTNKTDASGTTSYAYSINNRLNTITTPTISASYQYDPMGRRIKKTVNGTDTFYLWDQNVLMAELDSAGNILKAYLHNPDNNEPISMTEGVNTYWYLNDHLMTPQKMVDSSLAVVWAADYSSFGSVAIVTSLVTNNLRFPGQHYDEESGLHYNLNRDYKPGIGRYIESDPSYQLQPKGEYIPYNLPYLISVPGDLNPYSYAKNNPLIYADVFGLNSEECCYEYNWMCKKCLKRGPKVLNTHCFLECIAKFFPHYITGTLICGAMIGFGRPILGGLTCGLVAHHIYIECYVPCKKCPLPTMKF